MKRINWILVAFPVLAGCYHYVPAVPETAPIGTPVRARLNEWQEFELAAVTVNNIDQVEGEMVRIDGSELVLSATWLQAVTGNGYVGNGWTVRIPESNVTAFEEKKFSWWRSGVIFGGLLAGTWLGFDALGIGPFGGSGAGGTTNPQ